MSELTCFHCHESYEYEDDGETVACMPDGVFPYGGPDWLCDECMTCACGCSCFLQACGCGLECGRHGVTYSLREEEVDDEP